MEMLTRVIRTAENGNVVLNAVPRLMVCSAAIQEV